jgi:hypothetical protein
LQRPFYSGNLFYPVQLKKVSAEPIIDMSTLREMLVTEPTDAMRSIEPVDASDSKGKERSRDLTPSRRRAIRNVANAARWALRRGRNRSSRPGHAALHARGR